MTVDLSAALTADIVELCRYVGAESESVTGPLQTLSRDVTLAVSSYVGLQVVLPDHGHPIVFTSFLPGTAESDITASFRLPLAVLRLVDVKVDASSAIVFYAGVPGAFVDLAADLSFALGLPDPLGLGDVDPAGEADQPPSRIRVDHDLVPGTFEPGLTGVAEVSTVNRAVGFLVADGLHPEEAHRELRRRATALGITVLMYASQLIRPDSTP